MPGRRNLFSTLKNKAQTAVSRFLYEERGSGYGSGAYMEEEPPYEEEKPRRGRRSAQQRAAEEPPVEQAWQAPYQGTYQQPVYAQQQPQQYQQAPQPQPMTQFAAQMEEQRSRSKQENPNMVPFPGQYAGEQPAQEQQAQTPQAGICVLNLRNNAECRLAISMLRQGNALMVIMENVGDSVEMRRYVDTLSGACFSLNATITKVSRHGAYLLAPGTFAVMADSATSQMNSMQRRPQQAQPRAQARANPYAPQQGAYQPSYQNPTDENGFEYRGPAPEPQQAAFYYQQPMQAPAAPNFESQRPGTGYVPDRVEAVN